MNCKKRYLTGIAGAILICLLAIGTAGAYDADIACMSLREVIAGSHNVTTLELVALGPQSASQMKLWTESVINPEETLCTYLKSVIRDEATAGRLLSRIVLTLTTGEERISYELSPSTNLFIKLEEPFNSNISPPGTDQENSFPSFEDRFLLKKGLTKSSVLAILQRIQKGGSSPVMVTQSDTGLHTGTLQEARNAQITQLVAGYSSGQGNIASMKSELIRKYTSG